METEEWYNNLPSHRTGPKSPLHVDGPVVDTHEILLILITRKQGIDVVQFSRLDIDFSKAAFSPNCQMFFILIPPAIITGHGGNRPKSCQSIHPSTFFFPPLSNRLFFFFFFSRSSKRER